MQIKIITLTNYHDECDNATQIKIEFFSGQQKKLSIEEKRKF